MHRVAVLALAPVVGYDMAIPPLFFGQAKDESGRPLYEVTVVGLGGRPVEGTSGYAILPAADESLLSSADTVVIPGTRTPRPRRHGILDPELASALALIRPGTRIVSICTGAFVLAAAGLLDGRRATTHWSYREDFTRLYPQVDLDPEVLFVDEGDLLTSAGLAAGADLCLHLIRRDHGAAVANAVARHCVVPPWRDGGQAQFIERPLPSGASTGSTAAAREWALAHLGAAIDNASWARRAHLSLRTFNRRFLEETGRTPRAWLIDRRVDRALALLETTDLEVDRIATDVGLGTGASLRAHLRDRLGVSPSAYRRTFRGLSA